MNQYKWHEGVDTARACEDSGKYENITCAFCLKQFPKSATSLRRWSHILTQSLSNNQYSIFSRWATIQVKVWKSKPYLLEFQWKQTYCCSVVFSSYVSSPIDTYSQYYEPKAATKKKVLDFCNLLENHIKMLMTHPALRGVYQFNVPCWLLYKCITL